MTGILCCSSKHTLLSYVSFSGHHFVTVVYFMHGNGRIFIFGSKFDITVYLVIQLSHKETEIMVTCEDAYAKVWSYFDNTGTENVSYLCNYGQKFDITVIDIVTVASSSVRVVSLHAAVLNTLSCHVLTSGSSLTLRGLTIGIWPHYTYYTSPFSSAVWCCSYRLSQLIHFVRC